MLFNSAEFIFVFLPVTFLAFYVSARFLGPSASIGALVLAALVFYGQWEPWHLLVLIPSIAINYGLSNVIIRSKAAGLQQRARTAVILAISLNLLALIVFKYFDFLSANAAAITGGQALKLGLSLPLGISFFTFTQITYLVDGYRGRAEVVSPLRYALFVTYFPHLIAGPILHHSEILPQFDKPRAFKFDRVAMVDGGTLFMVGLAKKVILADQLAVFANVGFQGAAGGDISLFSAWGAALCYSFQLYFDFSGYSDMAVGIARMMGVDLPLNFWSPYKSTSIAEFWRRWHMTLSRFLREYVYIPLGGNRKGEARRYLNLFLTMLLGGIWHGAGWTFFIWGALHGAFLAINHAFDRVVGVRKGAAAAVLAWALTFLCVVVAWVFFRAPDLATAIEMLRGMSGVNGAYLPAQITQMSPLLVRLFGDLGQVPMLADGTVMGLVTMVVLLAASLLIALGCRNLYEMSVGRRILIAAAVTPFLIQAVLFSRSPSEFIYFQF